MMFPFSALTLLVGWQEGQPVYKENLMLVCWWWLLFSSYSSSCHHHLHHP